MGRILGIDGCKGGWVAAFRNGTEPVPTWDVFKHLKDVLARFDDIGVLAIDIPIGLTDRGPRECDVLARKMLGLKRGTSVFPAPLLPVLRILDYPEACRVRNEIENKKMSLQAFNIMDKIREVHDLIGSEPRLAEAIYEVHPEVSFYEMAGGIPAEHKKKRTAGIEERIGRLSQYYKIDLGDLKETRAETGVPLDDLIDAVAALWSAERIFAGRHRIIPETQTNARSEFKVINV